jgi:hypothetical protein
VIDDHRENAPASQKIQVEVTPNLGAMADALDQG